MRVARRSSHNDKEKIILPFSLLEDGKRRLQSFFDENYDKLVNSTNYDPSIVDKAKSDLRELVKQVFPEHALEEIGKSLRGESEYAVLVKNCPEIKRGSRFPKKNYAYYIGNALYEINNYHTVYSSTLVTKYGKSEITAPSHVLHRDMMNEANGVILSCPINEEHAYTELVRLGKVLNDIPKEHSDTKLKMTISGEKITTTIGSFADVQSILKNKTNAGIRFLDDEWEPKIRATFQEKVAAHSEPICLKPGDLLIFNEHVMFHRGHVGTQLQYAENQKGKICRIVLHNAAAPNASR